MRTVLVLLPVGLNVRNLLYTGVVDEIASGDDVRVVALSRVPDLPQRYETRSASVLFDAFPPRKPRTLTALLHAMLRRRFYGINGTRSTEILARGPLSSLRHQSLIDTVLGQPLPRSRMIYAGLRALERRLPGRVSDDVREVFARHRPSLIVSTNPTTLQEYDIIRHAKTRGVKTLGIIKSWDVLTMKGYIPLPVDHYIVWNELMKSALMRLHGVAEDRIAVTGIPQFDLYSDRVSIPPREDFFSTLNLDPKSKTVLYASSSPVINPEDPQILRRLVPALVASHKGPVQVIARLHEQDNPERYEGFEHPNLAYQMSEGHGRVGGDHEFSDPTLIGSLRDTLFHCDVVINTASTTSLDALAMGRRVVNIGFDLEPTKYHRSRRRYYDFDHYQPIVDSGTVEVASSFDECVSMMVGCLERAPRDEPRVQTLLAKMCWKLDGRSAERMASSVLRVANTIPVARPPNSARA